MPAGSSRVDQQRSEPLHPPKHCHVVDRDAALRQQLFHVSIGQAVAQVPSHGHEDHVEGDAMVKQMTGAQVVMMAEDVEPVRKITPGGKPHPIDRIITIATRSCSAEQP